MFEMFRISEKDVYKDNLAIRIMFFMMVVALVVISSESIVRLLANPNDWLLWTIIGISLIILLIVLGFHAYTQDDDFLQTAISKADNANKWYNSNTLNSIAFLFIGVMGLLIGTLIAIDMFSSVTFNNEPDTVYGKIRWRGQPTSLSTMVIGIVGLLVSGILYIITGLKNLIISKYKKKQKKQI